jgi:hypothetical protein
VPLCADYLPRITLALTHRQGVKDTPTTVSDQLIDEVFQRVERNLGAPIEGIPRDVLAAFVWRPCVGSNCKLFVMEESS